MATLKRRVPASAPQALGIARAAYEYFARLRQRTKQFVGPSSEPGHRLQARRHEDPDRPRRVCSSGAPRGMAATRTPFLNGEGSIVKVVRGKTAVRGNRRGDPDTRRLRYVREYPVERWTATRDLHNLRRAFEIQRLIIARAISGVHIR